MYCGNCLQQTSEKNRYCEHCSFDLIHLQKLLNEPDEVEEEEEGFRPASEVARRCLILCAVVAVSHEEDRTSIIAWLKSEGLWKDVSPDERSLFQSKKPTKKKLIQASWRVEALHVLLWALQLVPTITDDKTRADQSSLKKLLPFRASTSNFVINSELRADSAIFDMKDAIYQAQWTVRDAEVNGKPAPQDIDPGIIVERHYAINWLMGYLGQAWDDVTTDT